jgi:insertion element IS1 protein InsB
MITSAIIKPARSPLWYLPKRLALKKPKWTKCGLLSTTNRSRCWLWRAIGHNTGIPLAYCFGTREHKNLDALLGLLAPFRIATVYSDGNYAYKNRITESAVVAGKRNTQRIESKHLSLRTWCSRLAGKASAFQNSTECTELLLAW